MLQKTITKGIVIKKELEKDIKKRVKCYECQGYDYIQSECANTLKKKKLLCVTWNDDDSSSGFDSKKDHQNFIAFTANVKDDFKKELDTGCDEDFLKTYKDMLGK
uniref:Uncharacterized protein n=1 Tax=Gossypium raimondii TaxID=29730 RepID=A0A0D2SV03_GOSRA|nr:hypothetical protein B456_010G182300 [Gossypium raimondii]